MKSDQYRANASLNVNEFTEKKGNLTYLSWTYALDQVLRADPTATWEWTEPTYLPNKTVIVYCRLNAFGVTHVAPLPVMDHKNKAIVDPDAFAVNTAMWRAFAKAVATFGIGLYIYAGEDLPPVEAGRVPEADLADLKAAIEECVDRESLTRVWKTCKEVCDKYHDHETHDELAELSKKRAATFKEKAHG